MSDKLPLQSPNLVSQNIERIAALFPNCITETANGKAIDFDLLKQELNTDIVDGLKERYRLEWAGKREAIVTANLPTTKTLRPIKADSVDFDTTQNLYIEGDNLEALKLLQESYLGKVKMIYIDPPYNTGNDFVYKDNFTQSKDLFEQENALKDEYNQRLVTNPETSGRYHSDWLTMMYPRLKLARNLLTDDGVIFISIDDNEVHNLRKLCDEIFGEGNFVSNIIWQKKTGASDAKTIASITEYVLIYSKHSDSSSLKFGRNFESYDLNRYKLSDEFLEERGNYYIDNLDRGGLQYSESLNYGISCPDGSLTFPNGRKSFTDEGWIWKWSKKKLEWAIENKFIEFRKSNSKESGWAVCYKNYLFVDNEGNKIERSAPLKNLITDILNANSAADIKSLFDTNLFSYSKPVQFIKSLLKYYLTNINDIILDFFSGSATTAHAVMQLNAEDGGNRKFIMVQVPEATDPKSEAFKAGYTNICEIGKERIRRAATKIKKEKWDAMHKQANKDNIVVDYNDEQDYGFRVYRLDSSNMQDVYYKPQDYKQENLDLFASNIKPDRTAEDLLTQVMLSWGLPLHYKIETLTIQGKQVFKVEQDSLFACFDNGIDEAFAKEIATHQPLRIVFKDDSFTNDTAKENVKQLLKQLSPNTEMKVI